MSTLRIMENTTEIRCSKMTHLEYFKLADTYILFDYQNRNPLNQEARVCKVEIDKVRIK